MAAMRWLLHKLDSLTGTILATVGGLAAAQLPVFVQQYAQRLGGHVDEARHTLVRTATDGVFKTFDPAVRLAVEASARDRLLMLEHQQQVLDAATPLWRPVAFAQSFDSAIASATLERFVPAVPLDLAGLVYAGAGILLTWLLYELLKVPFLLAGQTVRTRRARMASRHPAT